ncbi:MAG TPA: AtpZ/AtpI family protein [Steroidobacteraceae bacterium]
MIKPVDSDGDPAATHFGQQIAASVARKLDARRSSDRIVWSGLGMMGLVGWSVSVPTLLGAALGIWLDKHHPAAHSWTLSLLIAGLTLGCWNAWRWVARENDAMHRSDGGGDE